jgi:hypothetical protein
MVIEPELKSSPASSPGNGYATKAPEMLVEFRGLRRYGRGHNAYYAIQLGRIVKMRR